MEESIHMIKKQNFENLSGPRKCRILYNEYFVQVWLTRYTGKTQQLRQIK